MNSEQIRQEISFRTSRSGGKGGQNVNKVETKVEARVNIAASAAFSEEEKLLLLEKLGSRLASDGFLSATNQTKRSQLANKQLAEHKLLRLIEQALIQPKKRKRHKKMPKAIKEARFQAKKRQSEKKAARKVPRHL